MINNGSQECNYNNAYDVLKRVGGVVEFMGSFLVEVNQTGLFGNTPLAIVISWGDFTAAKLLLDAGADVNKIIEDGETVLHRAVSFREHKIAELLLSHQASISIKDCRGETPLDIARSMGDELMLDIINKSQIY